MSTENKPISYVIRKRIEKAAASVKRKEQPINYYANDNISQFIKTPAELDALEKEVESRVDDLLRALVIDTERDHNTQGTAKRMAKMFVREIFAGRYATPPAMTEFPNASALDEILVVGPIRVNSTCSHHFQPIVGKCWIGILPDATVAGLSKYNRLVNFVMGRPQIQEEATAQIADMIEQRLSPQGIGVIIQARHFCMCARGVQDDGSYMTTSVMRGAFRAEPSIKQEFLKLVSMQHS